MSPLSRNDRPASNEITTSSGSERPSALVTGGGGERGQSGSTVTQDRRCVKDMRSKDGCRGMVVAVTSSRQ